MAKSNRRDGEGRRVRRPDVRGFGFGHRSRPLAEELEARRLLAVAINEFGGATAISSPSGITTGPDGNLWFTESSPEAAAIGRITPSGAIQNYSVGITPTASPRGITAAPDGALWFTEPGSDSIGRITTSGVIVEFPLPTPGAGPDQIAAGSDGDLWFSEGLVDKIGRIDPKGAVTEYPLPRAGSTPAGITLGPDGALWFTESTGDRIGRITTAGGITEFTAGISPLSGPTGITTGPDGNLWFTESIGDRIGRVTLAGVVTEFSTFQTLGMGPERIASGSDGQLWFTDRSGNIQSISTRGNFFRSVTFGGQLEGITSGPDGNLWAVSTTGNKIGRLTTSATLTTFPPSTTITPNSLPFEIAAGPDGANWFTEFRGDAIGRVDASGGISEFKAGITTGANPFGIALGPVPTGTGSQNLWFTETGLDQIGEITPQGVVTEHGGLSIGGRPQGITLGPDGALWFAEASQSSGSPAIGRITAAGVVQEFPLTRGSGFVPRQIATGPDGALWFTLTTPSGGEVGRLTTAGLFSFFTIPNDSANLFTSQPRGIVAGTNNDLWFADDGNHAIGRITTVGAIQEFNQGLTRADVPSGITLGPDGNYWFSDPTGIQPSDPVGRITPQGVITLFATPTEPSNPRGITTGPDGNLWFAESTVGQVGQLVLPQSSVTSLVGQPVAQSAGHAFNGNVATFNESSPLPTAANFDALVDWGDGSTADLVRPTGSAGSFAVPGSHTYANPGIYTGKLTVFNEAGSRSTSFTANIARVIVVTGSPFSVPANRTFTTVVATFSDADGPRPPNAYDLLIQWGDGTSSTGTLATSPQGQLEVVGTHDYPVSANYKIGVAVRLKANPQVSGSVTTPVNVTAAQISVIVDPLTHATAENAFAGAIANFTDANYVDTSSLITPRDVVTIDWGDGSPQSSGRVAPSLSSTFTVSASHAYAKIGTYLITVAVLNPDTLDQAVGTGEAEVEVAGPINEVRSGISGQPNSIASGPDGNLWFTESIPSADPRGAATPAIGRITTGGVVSEFTAGLPAGSRVIAITAGPDGNLWFTQDVPPFSQGAAIGRITPQGIITEFSQGLDPTLGLAQITLGPDGNLWFTQPSRYASLAGGVGRITPRGAITEFRQGLPSGANPGAITAGPDGNLWFTNLVVTSQGTLTSQIGRVSTGGAFASFPLDGFSSNLGGITSGPDGALWFTRSDTGGLTFPGPTGPRIDRITTAGAVTEYRDGLSADSFPLGITQGPDGNLWFVDSGTNRVDRITTTGVISPFAIPTGVSQSLHIATGSDNNLWFTQFGAGQVGQVVMPQGVVPSGNRLAGIAGVPLTNAIFATFSDRSTLVDLGRFFTPDIAFGDGSGGGAALVPVGPNRDAVQATHTYASVATYNGAATLTNVIGTTAPAGFRVDVGTGLSFVVTNTNDAGPGSLRQVIQNANQVGGHVITFAIPISGVATIRVGSPLPAITGPSVIDGPSQAAFEGVVPAHPLVEIDGEGSGGGLTFAGNATNSLLLSVSIYGFAGAQVAVNAPGVTLYGDVLGLRADGRPPSISSPGADGLDVFAANVVIGGLALGQGNVISGNLGRGIRVAGPLASFATMVGNLVGLDPTGRAPRPNGLDGIEVSGGAGRAIIGPGNAVSGNGLDGIHLVASVGDRVFGNVVGTDVTGTFAVANGQDGIAVDLGSSSILVGGPDAGLGNVVSGNARVGVGVFTGSYGVAIASNRIGTDRSGTRSVGNGIAGVLLSDSPSNVVGPGNLVSGNGSRSPGAGVWIDGPGSTGDRVVGNRVGTEVSGEFPLANQPVGILVNQASGNVIGDGSAGSGNVVSGNSSIGVMIAGPNSSKNLVAGNLIGTDATGSRSVPNGSRVQGAGVYIDDAAGNTIGGTSLGLGNLISGNGFDGAQIYGVSSVGNLFEGNAVGTNLAGTGPLGNGEDGLLINAASGTRVIGNVFAANRLDGVTISGPGSTSTLLRGNVIGRGIGGQPLGNGAFGILLINGAPRPIQVGNVNVHNTLGPFRDTSLAAASGGRIAPSAHASHSKHAPKVAHGKPGPSGPSALHSGPKAKPHGKR